MGLKTFDQWLRERSHVERYTDYITHIRVWTRDNYVDYVPYTTGTEFPEFIYNDTIYALPGVKR